MELPAEITSKILTTIKKTNDKLDNACKWYFQSRCDRSNRCNYVGYELIDDDCQSIRIIYSYYYFGEWKNYHSDVPIEYIQPFFKNEISNKELIDKACNWIMNSRQNLGHLSNEEYVAQFRKIMEQC